MPNKKRVEGLHRYIEWYYQQKKYPAEAYPDTDNFVTVSAEISDDFLGCALDQKGAHHQHFYVDIKRVMDGDAELVEGKPVFVSVRYGDEEGLPEPIPGLLPGRPVIIRGKYIPSDEAYETDDNPGLPVLHFTHRPIGYVIFCGIKYD